MHIIECEIYVLGFALHHFRVILVYLQNNYWGPAQTSAPHTLSTGCCLR